MPSFLRRRPPIRRASAASRLLRVVAEAVRPVPEGRHPARLAVRLGVGALALGYHRLALLITGLMLMGDTNRPSCRSGVGACRTTAVCQTCCREAHSLHHPRARACRPGRMLRHELCLAGRTERAFVESGRNENDGHALADDRYPVRRRPRLQRRHRGTRDRVQPGSHANWSRGQGHRDLRVLQGPRGRRGWVHQLDGVHQGRPLGDADAHGHRRVRRGTKARTQVRRPSRPTDRGLRSRSPSEGAKMPVPVHVVGTMACPQVRTF